MKVVIHDQAEVPARLRSHAEQRLARLSRHWDRILETEVHFGMERKRSQEPGHLVRIVVRLDGRKHSLLKAEELAIDMQAALDLALDSVDRQLLKLKGKVKERKVVPKDEAALAGVQDGGQDDWQDGEGPAARPATRRRVRLRPESVEQAQAELASGTDAFRVFLNEASGEMNVAYRRRDGSFAIIEPVIP
ncbi:MAG: ribosome hibernation-promoting factor, HPF/YfiA family [Candidatus Dormibacterales bacterium]